MRYAIYGRLLDEERVIYVKSPSKQKLNNFIRDMFGGKFIVCYIETLGH